MKLNNKGFAISGVLYPVFVLFLVLIFGIVGVLSSSKTLIDRVRNEVEMELNGEDLTPTITMTGSDITIANGYTFDLMEGVKAFDYEGKELGPERISYNSTPTFSNTVNGVYEVEYTASDIKGRTKTFLRTLRVETGNIYDFAYTGGAQTFTSPASALYKVETWGAQGGGAGGRGAYTTGEVNITANQQMHVYVGGLGGALLNPYTLGLNGGYNGGGSGGFFTAGAYPVRVPGGGGATDVRTYTNRFRYVRDYISGSTANTGNHWVEIQVFDKNDVNIAFNRPATCNTGGSSLALITDNSTAFNPYASCNAGSGQWVEIDLGAEYEISYIRVWHYHGDPRTYYQSRTTLYNSDRSYEYDVFNSDHTSTYQETAAGIQHNVMDWSSLGGLRSRIMVAAGGGSGGTGGAGGTLSGLTGAATGNGVLGGGGTQTAGGTSANRIGKFGIGGDGFITLPNSPNCNDGYAAGGGYYGGGGGTGGSASCTPTNTGTGGGGSSFISGHTGVNAINMTGTHTGQPNHYSGLVFTNTSMIAGNAVMPAPSGGTQTGNSGDGYARITFLKKINID
jgi:hypothetical protein